jgi:hypothetical protein
MAFDIGTAKPVTQAKGGFDLSTAKPAMDTVPTVQQPSALQQSGEVPYSQEQTAAFGPQYTPPAKSERTIGDRVQGGIEALGTVATGATGGTLGYLAGTGQGLIESVRSGQFGTPEGGQLMARRAQEGAARMTYKPVGEAGQEYVQAIGEFAAPLAAFAPMAGEMAAISSGITNLPMAARQVREIPKTIAAKRLLSEAAPEIPQLKDAARTIYSSLDDAGVTVAQPEIGKLAGDIASTVKRQGFNQRIHPKVSAALDEISDSAGKNMTLTELDTMRKVARAAASSIDPDESRLGSLMVEKIDDFLDDLPDQAVIKGQAQDVGPMYKQARGLWQRAKKAELLEDAVGKAKNQASGFENGLRAQFRSLLNNKKKMRGFTAEEKAAMQKVVQGGGAENALKFLGKFGFTEGQATSMLGSSIGVAAGASVAGAPGAVAVPLIGQVSKQLAQRLTRGNASFANQIIRSGRDGRAIALSYVRNTPAAQRSAAELTELLMRPGVSLESVKAIKNPIIQDAAFYAELAKAQAASQSARQENVQQEDNEPVNQ